MALYLGNSDKLKVNLSNAVFHFNLFSKTPITNGIRLLSSDGYILKGSDLLYITTTKPFYLLSFDDYILKDSNGLVLIIKENE